MSIITINNFTTKKISFSIKTQRENHPQEEITLVPRGYKKIIIDNFLVEIVIVKINDEQVQFVFKSLISSFMAFVYDKLIIGKISLQDFINRVQINYENIHNYELGVRKNNPSDKNNSSESLFLEKYILPDLFFNKFSFFNQLHRDLNKNNFDEIFNEDQIKLVNDFHSIILLKISHSSREDEIFTINTKEFFVCRRLKNSIYKLWIGDKLEVEGLTFNVKTGCIYYYNQNKELVSLNGNHDVIKSQISRNFNNKFGLISSFGVFYDFNDQSMCNLIDENKILVVNKHHSNILIRLTGSRNDDFEDMILIEPFVYTIFKREPGKQFAFIKKDNQEITKEFHTNKCYVIFKDIESFEGIKSTQLINYQIIQQISAEKNVLVHEKCFILPNNKFFNTTIGEKWMSLRKFIFRCQNISRLSKFSCLLFNYIIIKNRTSEILYIRINQRKYGSEEFYVIKPNLERKWKRLDGNYITEIVTLDSKSTRFIVESGGTYNIYDKVKMENVSTKSMIDPYAQYLPQTNGQLIYFDEEINLHVRIKIEYQSEIYSHNRDEYEFFEGKKPNYIPGQSFFDVDFPANENKNIIKGYYEDGITRKIPHFKHSEIHFRQEDLKMMDFKRPNEVFKNQFYLFKDEICFDSVKQGKIGNCYLISVIVSLCKRPELIHSIFKTKTINPDGFYELFYYEDNQKKLMFIDDFLVTTKGPNSYYYQFAQSNEEELWVMLIEKAYAKYEGGYGNIFGGYMHNEFTWLTGKMSKTFEARDPKCWNEILRGIKKNFLITTCSHSDVNFSIQSQKGIANGHAYSILDAKEYKKDDKSIRLLQLRNPWGNADWFGDYNDYDLKWTYEMEKFFEYEKSRCDKGIFFISFEDFIDEFNTVAVCCVDI